MADTRRDAKRMKHGRIPHFATNGLPSNGNVSKLAQATKAGSDRLAVDTEKQIAAQILRDAESIPAQSVVEPSLLTTMAQRLRVVEAQLRAQTIELQSKQQQLDHVKDQLNQSVAPCGWCADHQAEAATYKKQVAEMTAFLNDHGLVWVGSTPQPTSPGIRQVDAHNEVDFDLIIARITQLNAAAGEDVSTVVKDNEYNQVHRLQPKASMALTLFRDGIMLMRGPFRSFQDAHTIAFINDVVDGFFPTELKDGYPDGIVFNIYDKRHDSFSGVAASSGQPLHAPPTKSQSLADIGHPLLHLSANTLLTRLPESTICNGQVHSIRDEVAQLLSPPVEPPVDCRVVHVAGDPGVKVATLRVRTWKGAQTIELHVPYTATLEHVKAHVSTESGHPIDTFDIISSFPSKVHEDTSQTLEGAGLVPTTTLHIRMR